MQEKLADKWSDWKNSPSSFNTYKNFIADNWEGAQGIKRTYNIAKSRQSEDHVAFMELPGSLLKTLTESSKQ